MDFWVSRNFFRRRAMPRIRRPTVLVLHDWGSHAKRMAERNHALANRLEDSGYYVLFRDAPHVLPRFSNVQVKGYQFMVDNELPRNARAWFYYNPDDFGDSRVPTSTVEYIGLYESISILRNDLSNNFPSVSIIGLGQGAIMAHIYAQFIGRVFPQDGIRSFIFIGGSCSQHYQQQQQTRLFPVPSLHIIARNGTVFPPERSIQLAQQFENPQFFYHDKNHIPHIPKNAEVYDAILQFLNQVHDSSWPI
jgi:pimeloyl-ACP methyl ester carboxylesterase